MGRVMAAGCDSPAVYSRKGKRSGTRDPGTVICLLYEYLARGPGLQGQGMSMQVGSDAYEEEGDVWLNEVVSAPKR